MTQEATETTDLTREVSDIDPSIAKEMVFQHIRTGREPRTIYSMVDGEPITLPVNVARAAMRKKREDGSWMFTQNQSEAPEYRKGTHKCFLHAESAERQSGLLAELGLSSKVCVAGQLASDFAAELHAEKIHSKEWERVQRFRDDQEKKADRERQEKQLEATLSLARGGSGPLEDCPDCEYRGTAKQLRGHKMGAHQGVK